MAGHPFRSPSGRGVFSCASAEVSAAAAGAAGGSSAEGSAAAAGAAAESSAEGPEAAAGSAATGAAEDQSASHHPPYGSALQPGAQTIRHGWDLPRNRIFLRGRRGGRFPMCGRDYQFTPPPPVGIISPYIIPTAGGSQRRLISTDPFYRPPPRRNSCPYIAQY